MMKANEAYEIAVKALTEDVTSHLMKIEENIRKACNAGNFFTSYFNGVIGLDKIAKEILVEQLTQAGYTYEWTSNGLWVYWKKK